MLGHDQRVILHLLEIPAAMKARSRASAMELDDGALPLRARHRLSDDPAKGFDGVQHRAARRRPPAHEGHGALRPARGQRQIFSPQGKALNEGAADDVRVLVVGNPANTNASSP